MPLTELLPAWFSPLESMFRHPGYLLWIPVALVFLFFLVRLNLVRYGFDEHSMRKIRRLRWGVFLLRFLAVSMVLVALATPFTTIATETDGDPSALVLVDRSGSMSAYDLSLLDHMLEGLEAQLPTTVREFGSELESPVGDASLGHPEHVLLVSDGQANAGVSLLDVAQVIRSENLSMSMIDLASVHRDHAVTIDAPEAVPLGFPAKVRVEVTSTQEAPVPLTVTVDGRTVHDAPALGIVEIEQQLGTGYHRIEARLPSGDAREQNNVFYWVIQVLEKPRVLVLSDGRGPLEQAISGLFQADITSSMPRDLSPYYAVFINDMKASQVGNVPALAEFLRDPEQKYGNGLVVFGGFNSYDRGGYQNTQLESLLPVKVGKPKRDFGENSLVFVIQVSGSTTAVRYESDAEGNLREIRDEVPTIDVIKAQAVNAINSLNLRNNVGVVAFGVSTAGESYGSADETLAASVVRIADVRPLYDHKQEITQNIPRLTGGGTTAPDIALRAAVDMLKDKSGDKTIILLTNGRFSAGLGAGADVPAKANTLAVVQNAYRRYGIKTQTLGVGSTDVSEFARKVDEAFLKDVAVAGDSTYDRATNMASLMVKYGDPEEKGFGDSFSLVPLSLTHFITRDVELDAILNGYNEVAPKDGSRILVAADMGLPALTVWNYFNGRAASVTVFTASGPGPLLQGDNSDLIRNTLLWAAGDPSRKQDVTVRISDAVTQQAAEAVFTSKTPIAGDCADTRLDFKSSSGDTYTFTFTPEQKGFFTVCGVPYAVNGPSEYWRVGMSGDIETAVQVTGGGVFGFDQIDEIVETIKTVSSRVAVKKTELRSPFIAIALILFLLEIFIRRLTKVH